MKYKLENHITGKVYDPTQENMIEMIEDIEDMKTHEADLQRKLFTAILALRNISTYQDDNFTGYSPEAMAAKQALKELGET